MMEKYPKLKAILEPLRARAGIGTQTELASLVGATQQTVSRWEKGESRPREKEIPRLAAVLRADPADLLAAAGYGVGAKVVTSVDKPFPLHGLSPESFERFCFYLLQKLYRGQDAQAHRAGESGHGQGGIDIRVQGRDWLHTFQCKRVVEFGPKRVAAVVAAQTVVADKKVVMLSSVASPQAREEIARYPGWGLWDREDISMKVRSLPLADQRELVQIFFRSQRFELLGELEASPWLTVSAFFAPFKETDRTKLFNHNWKLVGRSSEASALSGALEDQSVTVALLVGPAGEGKSRLLRHVLEEHEVLHPDRRVWMLSPTDQVTAKSLEELGQGEKLLVVDDAHDRDDLAVLMRYCAIAQNRCRLLLALRKYGLELVKSQAASLALTGEHVKVVELLRPSVEDVENLAIEVLKSRNGQVAVAKDLARITRGSALATVIGAQIVAKEGMHPVWMNNDRDLQTLVLSRFQDIITGGIATGQDVERLQGVLRVVALVQPVLPDEPALVELVEVVEGVRPHDATRLLKTLTDAGILFRRGGRYRLAPDLLADSIIERHCLDTAGGASYTEQIFDKVEQNSTLLKNLLLNLAKLDWRRREGDTRDSTLLRKVWSKLRWREPFFNPHVEAAASIAYYQPKLALEFAGTLVREGHGDDERVCELIKYAAYNYDFLDEACMLLWQAGNDKDNAADFKGRAIGVLKDLATYEPNKPPEFIAKVVDFAIALLLTKEARSGAYSPFQILEGALEAEGHTSSAKDSRTITMSAYAVPLSEVEGIRAAIVEALFGSLSSAPIKRAVQAARCLNKALDKPRGLMGLQVPVRDDAAWDASHRKILSDLVRLLEDHKLPATVLVRLAEAVHWHAYYGKQPQSADLAQRVIRYLERDLDTRMTRALMDGWGSNTWPIDDGTYERSEHETEVSGLLADLKATYQEGKPLYDYVSKVMRQIDEAGSVDTVSQHVFLNRLIAERSDLAQEIVRVRVEEQGGPLVGYAGVALGVLLSGGTEESRQRVQQLVQGDSAWALEVVAEAYARADAQRGYQPNDVEIIRRIFSSKSESVLRIASSLLRTVARVDQRLAAELVCLVDFSAAGPWVREFFLWVGNKDSVPEGALTDSQLETLVAGLDTIDKLDDHWIWRFLKFATRRVPGAVVALVKRRLDAAVASDTWWRLPLATRHRQEKGLELLKIDSWRVHLVDLLSFGLERIGSDRASCVFGPAVVALCGEFSDDALSLLLGWMRDGASFQHVRVVSAVIRDMPSDLLYRNQLFAQEALAAAQDIDSESIEALRSTLGAVTMSGVRGGTPGKPFPQDLAQERLANDMLARLSRLDPAYELYSELLRHARRGIERQVRQKEAMDADDEERG